MSASVFNQLAYSEIPESEGRPTYHYLAFSEDFLINSLYSRPGGLFAGASWRILAILYSSCTQLGVQFFAFSIEFQALWHGRFNVFLSCFRES
jgi:hypothetical protein